MNYSKILPVAISICMLSCGPGEQPASDVSSKETVAEMSKGEQLFNSYCLQCHTLDKDRIGPQLKGAFARWDNDTARIGAFIKNARAAIDAGDPRAVQVAKDWNNALMTPMPHLSDEDIDHLLEYIAE